MKAGTLYLIPNLISPDTQKEVLPPQILLTLSGLRYFLAEDVRTARRYFSSLGVFESIEALHFSVLDKETRDDQATTLMQPLFDGHSMGVVSESGCPGVADPGALAVRVAHEHGVRVVPLVGPSSILLALMASGLNGQRFAFNGYLPIDAKEGALMIKGLEKDSRTKLQTQIFIETPYRNNAVFTNLLKNLQDNTLLCVALDVTGRDEKIQTMPVKKWKTYAVNFPKTPAVFLFLAQ